MKKILGLLLMVSVFGGTCVWAYDNSVELQELKKQQAEVKQYIPYYKNLATCNPYKNQYYQIYGKKNGQCHVKLMDNAGQNYDCNIPMTVASVNSSMGKSALTRISSFNLESTDASNISTLNSIMGELLKVAEIESKMIQYHCKPIN